MLAAPSIVELAGPRLALHRPPRGTSSRILAIRLRQCCHRPMRPGGFAHHMNLATNCGLAKQPIISGERSLRGHSALAESRKDAIESETTLLQQLVSRFGSRATLTRVDHDANSKGANMGCVFQDRNMESGSASDDLETMADQADLRFKRPFRSALKAMQQRDSRRLLISLKEIVAMPEEDLVDAVSILPRATFSEFLQMLDPLQIGPSDDPTHGVHIGVGMWEMLNLDHAIDEWGIRKIYVRLLQRMLVLVHALRTSGQDLNVNDYIPLLRATGAASDMTGASLLWKQMQRPKNNITPWRQTNHFDELVKARLLVDPVYFGHDKKRVMVTPRNLHRQAVTLLPHRVRRLDRLRINLRARSYRFGLNKNVDHAEDLSRVLRRRKPVTRLFHYIQNHGYENAEKLLCSLMIGFGRAGKLRFLQYRILDDYFGILMFKDGKTGEVKIGPSVPRTTPHKDWARPVRRRIRITERLLHAAVETYCSNGQFSMAFKLVDYISNTYKIPVTHRIWFELLEWTHVMSSKDVRAAWKIAGMSDRVLKPSAVEMVWTTMTGEPYHVQPGFEQYQLLIRSLVARREYLRIFKYMSLARPFYVAQCAIHEDAVFQYVRALRDGIDGIAMSTAFRSYQRALFMKQNMWYQLSASCKMILQRYRSVDLHDSVASRNIPRFIQEFREFITNPALYRTATGYVQLRDPAHDMMHRVTVPTRGSYRVVPVSSGGRQPKWRLQRLRDRRRAILSTRSLADQKSSKLDPLGLLLVDLEMFRTPPRPTGKEKTIRHIHPKQEVE